MEYKSGEKIIDRIIFFLILFIPLYGLLIINNINYSGWDRDSSINLFTLTNNKILMFLIIIFILLSILNLFFLVKKLFSGGVNLKYIFIKSYGFLLLLFFSGFNINKICDLWLNLIYWLFKK